MRSIFISYRRDDTEGEAGRLFDDLVLKFGEQRVFMDVVALQVGRDFRKELDASVAACGVLLAIIGKDWLTAKDEAGNRRLDDPLDFVRLETASALKRDIPVIPVLVRGAKMPKAEQLPDDLKELSYRNGVELTHARWGSDLKLLAAALEDVLPKEEVPEPSLLRWWRQPIAVVAMGIVTITAASGAFLWHGAGDTSSSASPKVSVTPTSPTARQPGNNAAAVPPVAADGGIAAKYASLGGSGGILGKQETPVTSAPGGGFSAEFDNGYIMYASEATGAHFLHGAIRAKWLELGGPTGSLGYPITDEEFQGGGFVQSFSNGTITWTQEGGAIVHPAS